MMPETFTHRFWNLGDQILGAKRYSVNGGGDESKRRVRVLLTRSGTFSFSRCGCARGKRSGDLGGFGRDGLCSALLDARTAKCELSLVSGVKIGSKVRSGRGNGRMGVVCVWVGAFHCIARARVVSFQKGQYQCPEYSYSVPPRAGQLAVSGQWGSDNRAYAAPGSCRWNSGGRWGFQQSAQRAPQ